MPKKSFWRYLANPSQHWASPYTVVRHLAALYDRGVKEPEQVISCLNIVTETATANPVADIYVQLFTWRLHRWLKGVGYPEELKGIYISPAEYSAHAKSTTIRAARLLYSLTESWTLPASPSSRLRVRVLRHSFFFGLYTYFVRWTAGSSHLALCQPQSAPTRRPRSLLAFLLQIGGDILLSLVQEYAAGTRRPGGTRHCLSI